MRARDRIGLGLLFMMQCSPAFSAAQGMDLSLSTAAGAMYGVTQEIVWDWRTGSQYLYSRLDWQLAPLYLWGLRLGLSEGTGFYASLDVQAGLPLQTGSIEDRDWLNVDPAHTQTHFSRHENHAEQALLLDGRLGWSLPVAAGFTLQPFAQLGLMHFKFTARNGYKQYPSESTAPYTPWSTSLPRVALYGTGIALEQAWLFPAAGLDAEARFGEKARLSLSFAFSPVVICAELDNHFLRYFDFSELLTGGLLLEPRLHFDWLLTDAVRISAELTYRFITGAAGAENVLATGPAGQTYTDGTNTWKAGDQWSTPNAGGAAFSAAKALVMLTYSP